jgi:hypothetical protein
LFIFAAKLQQDTAKSCQYGEKNANKLVFMGGEDGWSWFLEGNRRNGISINVPYLSSGLCIMLY